MIIAAVLSKVKPPFPPMELSSWRNANDGIGGLLSTFNPHPVQIIVS
jgi:hypothetical protein